MQEKFLTESRKGKFILLGYRLPRHLSDPAVQIPADLFEERFVDWHNSGIKGAGLEFANVRVIEAPKIIPATENRLNPSMKPDSPVAIPENRRKRGRPLMWPLIEEAYNDLDATGAVQANARMTTIATAIQEWIKQHYPAYPAKAIPGYETIRVCISELRSKKQ
jgi:hypothetical protein